MDTRKLAINNLIYQVAVGDTLPNYYDVCMHSVQNYCSKYDIHYQILRNPLLKIKPLDSKRSANAVNKLGYLPIFEKENAFRHLGEFDNICIIDADVYIRDNAPNIFDQIEDAEFAGVKEKDLPLTKQYLNKIKTYSIAQYGNIVCDRNNSDHGIEFYNMGVMLLSSKISKYLKGQSPEEFIRRKEFERFVNGEGSWRWSTDQTLLNYWIRKENIKTKDLSWKWNALFKAVTDDKLKEAHFIHFFLANNLPYKGAEIPKIINDLNVASSIKGHY